MQSSVTHLGSQGTDREFESESILGIHTLDLNPNPKFTSRGSTLGIAGHVPLPLHISSNPCRHVPTQTLASTTIRANVLTQMAVRPWSTVCLFCRHQASLTTRRRIRIQHSTKRSLQVVALRHDENAGLVLQNTGEGEGYKAGSNDSVDSIADAIRRWKTNSNIPVNEIREGLLAFEDLVKLRDRRNEVLKNLVKSSPNPPINNGVHVASKSKPRLPEAHAGPISHATFRNIMHKATLDKEIRSALRAQLLRVQHPKDLLRIAAVVMMNHKHAEHFAAMDTCVLRALYRCRNTVTDAEVLATSRAIVARLRFAGFEPKPQLLIVGLKFAARARSVDGMKKYLKLMHERGDSMMTNHVFRSVIAKCSIGQRGLGEIRNGRWRRSDLLQVLTGFDDCKHLPPEKQFHLGAFLDRNDWAYLHGWVAVLGRCKASDAVWQEWLLWKQNSLRTNPRTLESEKTHDHRAWRWNTQWRGDYWFVEHMAWTDDLNRAWRVLEESEVPFSTLKSHVKMRLLNGVEHASAWTPELSEAMLEKYDAELSRIERAFGVIWEAGNEDGEGRHVPFRDQEEALDELGDPNWAYDDAIDYGFPTNDDESTMLPKQEKPLRDATLEASVLPART
jgi:hypothetical protein